MASIATPAEQPPGELDGIIGRYIRQAILVEVVLGEVLFVVLARSVSEPRRALFHEAVLRQQSFG